MSLLQGDNALTENLLKRLNKGGKLHMVPASFKGRYVIRFTVTSQNTTRADIERDWRVIREACDALLAEERVMSAVDDEEVFEAPAAVTDSRLISGAGRRKREGLLQRRREYGLSLILSNVPMSPNFINGSFVALFDDTNYLVLDYLKHLQARPSIDSKNRPIYLSPRRRLREAGKQYSLDVNASRPLVPRRTHLPLKQASLDSKIDVILDASFDSESHEDDDVITVSDLSIDDEVENGGQNGHTKLHNGHG